jgi:hypothetical protein
LKWKYIGVGRDDGITKGEYSPIFYNSEVHELISWRYFWLSETPDRPSRGWDANSIRICTVGRFGFKKAGQNTLHEFTILVLCLLIKLTSLLILMIKDVWQGKILQN